MDYILIIALIVLFLVALLIFSIALEQWRHYGWLASDDKRSSESIQDKQK